MQSVHQNAPARPWWSRSNSNLKLQSEKQANGSSKQPKKLNTLATAIGLKPKKHAIAIQEPPSPVLPLHTGSLEPPALAQDHHMRHGSSWDELTEPKTPSDAPKHLSYTQSVMTTSEIDPFAAQFIPTSPMTLASNRMSTFSDISTSESAQKADFTLSLNRQSFASSSENSHAHSYLSNHLPPPLPRVQHSRPDVPIDVGTSPMSSLLAGCSDQWRASRLTTASDKVIPREPPFLPLDAATHETSPQIRSSPSSSTLTDKPPRPDTSVARPKPRPRGMTDVGPTTRTPATPDPRFLPSSSQAASRTPGPPDLPVVMRVPSLNRAKPVPAAPAAPPAARLPLPPEEPSRFSSRFREPSPAASGSSSDISFASTSSKRDADAPHHAVRQARSRSTTAGARGPAENSYASPPVRSRELSMPTVASSSRPTQRSSNNSPRPRSEFSPTRTLKKAISTQSLRRTSNGSTIMPTTAPTSPIPQLNTEEAGKSVKKQRSFHHSRIPLPPLPTSLRHTSSTGSVSQVAMPELTQSDRRVSTASQASSFVQSPAASGRRRLFSSSSLRRSISSQAQSVTGEDDARSIFSFEDSRPKSSQRPLTAQTTTTADTSADSHSFWDDRELDLPTSPPAAAADYLPQHIMAPADMLKLEAALARADGDSAGTDATELILMRARGMSFTSVATSLSGTFSDAGMSGEGESLLSSFASSPLSHGSRSPRSPSSVNDQSRASTSSSPMLTPRRPDASLSGQLGVPPSPRSRRPSTADPVAPSPTHLSPDSAAASSALSPPPRPRQRPSTGTTNALNWDRRVSTAPVMPLSPPPAWKGIGRLRKTSQTSSTSPPPVSMPTVKPAITRRPSFLEIEEREPRASLDDSFLDMGKSSFDTTRSSSDEDYGR